MPAPLALVGLPVLFNGVVRWLVAFYLGGKLAKFAAVFTFATIVIALFAAMLAAIYGVLLSIKVIAPPEFSFAFGLLPPSVPVMYGAYMTILLAKRLFDWKYEFMKQVVSETQRPNWMKGVA